MDDQKKTPLQLVDELAALRRRVNELERREVEHKQAEEMLRESEARFRAVWEISTDAMALSDPDGIVLAANPAYSELYGYPLEEIIGHSFAVIFPPEQREWAMEQYRTVFAAPEIPPMFESKVRRADGTERVVESRIAFISRNGRRTAMLSTIHDITGRKQAEESLQKSEALLNEVGRIAKIGGWEMDLITREAVWTWGTYEIAEIDPDEVPPGPDDHIAYYLPEYQPLVADAMRALIEEDRPLDFEAKLQTAKGNIKWCRALGQATREQGVCIKVFGTFQDITERKQAEEKVKASLQEKEVLLQEIHHRVKNNLQVISSLLDMQADAVEDPRLWQALQDSQQRIRSMALVHEKLYQSENLARIDFAEYIQDMVDFLVMLYSPRVGHVVPRLEVETLALTIDFAIPCGLIVNELVSNALKHAFSPPPEEVEPEIRIAFQANPNGYHLTISDNGVGLPPEVDVADSPSLGLQLVNILVGQLQGSVSVNGDAGTQFTLIFPKQESACGGSL